MDHPTAAVPGKCLFKLRYHSPVRLSTSKKTSASKTKNESERMDYGSVIPQQMFDNVNHPAGRDFVLPSILSVFNQILIDPFGDGHLTFRQLATCPRFGYTLGHGNSQDFR